MTAYSNDDADIWKQFRREMIADGMKSSFVHRYKPLIRRHLKELAERGELEELPPEYDDAYEREDQDDDLEGESIKADVPPSRSEEELDAGLRESGAASPANHER